MKSSASTVYLHGWRLFMIIALVVVAAAALALMTGMDSIDGTRRVIRMTARTSFLLFLAAFTASAFAFLLPSPMTRGLLRERRIVGLSFAFSHLVHAVAIYALGQLNPEFWPGRATFNNLPGTIGYLFILALAFTSYRPLARSMGSAAWRRLHTTGMWVIAAVFAYSYLKRVPVNFWYAVPSALLLTAIAIRLIAKQAQVLKRNTRAATRTTFQHS
jgi:DMSO/TMAO reductase YedYZ heme-binding membrane subunit